MGYRCEGVRRRTSQNTETRSHSDVGGSGCLVRLEAGRRLGMGCQQRTETVKDMRGYIELRIDTSKLSSIKQYRDSSALTSEVMYS